MYRLQCALRGLSFCFAFLACVGVEPGLAAPSSSDTPTPLLSEGHPVDWWFVFKFNTASFPACGGAQRQCIFGGEVQDYSSFGQQYVFASSENQSLQKGTNCAGDTTADPIGATFDQVYNGTYFYVIWNDQFYDDPEINGCSKECGDHWGHSKGVLAWNNTGDGFVMQVTTPSWPGSGNKDFPRKADGNTLGCVRDDNVKVSQHFFALKLTKDDLIKVVKALANSSVVTDPKNPQIVNNGGPPEVRIAVERLGKKSASKVYTRDTLSSGVEVLSKPSGLAVPPWQLVSAVLGGIPLRTATWWYNPKIYSTRENSRIRCWDNALGDPGPVEIATTGQWAGKRFGLTGGSGPDFNHAKVGISTSGGDRYAILGDLNQQGSLTPEDRPCTSSQNGRGGLFYVLKEAVLADELKSLMTGNSAPTSTQ